MPRLPNLQNGFRCPWLGWRKELRVSGKDVPAARMGGLGSCRVDSVLAGRPRDVHQKAQEERTVKGDSLAKPRVSKQSWRIP